MIPTVEEIEALPPDDFAALRRNVVQVQARRDRRVSRVRPEGSLSATLASLRVGDSRTFSWQGPRELRNDAMAVARLRLGEPDAKWTARTTTHGVRVTRVR